MPDRSATKLKTGQLQWSAQGDTLEEGMTYWCELTGQNRQQVKNWGWVHVVHPEDQEHVRHIWQKYIQKPAFFSMGFRIQVVNGSYHQFRCKFFPLLDRENILHGWLSWLSDVTDETGNQDEQDSWKRHFLHSLLFEPSSVGGVWLSLDGRILQVNDKLCEICGYERHELISKQLRDIIYEEDRYQILADFIEMLKRRSEITSLVFRGVNRSQQIIWFNFTVMLIHGALKEPKYFLVLMEDITERKEAEEAEKQRLLAQEQAARESEQKALQEKQEVAYLLSAVFSSMLEGVIVVDTSGTIQQLNLPALNILELPKGVEYKGKHFHDIFKRYFAYRESDDSYEPFSITAIIDGSIALPTTGEIIVLRLGSGHEKDLSVTSTAVYDNIGTSLGRVIVFRDVTRRSRREKRILYTLNALLIFVESLANISVHETPFKLASNEKIGKQLANVIAYALQCQYVSVIAIIKPDYRLHMLGVSGLAPGQEQQYEQDINNAVMQDYFGPEALERLQDNKVVIRDLTENPYKSNLSDFGIPHRMIAPVFLHNELVGLFTIAKSDLDSGYTHEEVTLTQAVARLVSFFLERVSLMRQDKQD